MNNTTLIVMADARMAAAEESTLEGRVKAAMCAVKDHWMVTDKDQQFQGAVAAIYELSDEPTRERIKSELDALKTLSAMLSGVKVNMDELGAAYEPIGLMKTWREVNKQE